MIRKSIIISLSGTKLTKAEARLIKKDKPWGIILFKRNITSEDQLIKLTKSIKKIMKDKNYPILIDEEGGKVSRLSNILDNSQYSQSFFGKIYKLNKALGIRFYKTYLDNISKKLKKFGININNVPVLDLTKQKTHAVIGSRSYSKSVKEINELGKICIQTYKKNKIGTVIKHIPGHGSASADSHFKLPVVKETLANLNKADFKCFKNCKSHFAMTAHILYNKIDKNNNATHSSYIIKKIIRNNIGFKGILISDDISMKALKFDLVTNAKKALEAGCDLVLYCAGKTNESRKLLSAMPIMNTILSKKTSEFYKFLR